MECAHIIVKAVVAAAVAEVVEVNAVHIYIAVHVVVDNMTITVHAVVDNMTITIHVVVVVVHKQQRQEGILAKVHGLFITDMKTK